MAEDIKRGVPLAPSSMVDSVSEWNLNRVIKHLQDKERQSKDRNYVDSHVTSRYAVRMLLDTIDGLAVQYGVTRAQMSRWISYHALALLQGNAPISDLVALCSGIRKKALDSADADTLSIMNSVAAYRPTNVTECTVSLYLYEPWMRVEFQSKASLCGVRSFPLVQLFFMRSIATMEGNGMEGILEMFRYESRRWDWWLTHRLLEMTKLSTGAIWGVGGPPPTPIITREKDQ